MITEIEVKGLEGMEKALNSFGPELAGNVIRPAMAWGARIFRKAIVGRAKATFQAHTGRLFNEIDSEVQIGARSRFGFNARGAVIRWKIGMREAKHAPYARFWEDGFQHIGRGKSRARTLRRNRRITEGPGRRPVIGKFMRRQFMRPAFEAVHQFVLSGVIERIRAGVERVAEQVKGRAA